MDIFIKVNEIFNFCAVSEMKQTNLFKTHSFYVPYSKRLQHLSNNKKAHAPERIEQ